MIIYVSGDLLRSPAQVLVNTVNVVGVMEKGIAARFKQVYPDMFKTYQQYCESGQLQVGRLFLYKTPNKWILNFPTKNHWRNPSRVEYIQRGLEKFANSVDGLSITSIAFPQLGCGNGGLNFENQVKPMMESYLGKISVPTFVYAGHNQYDTPEHIEIQNTKDWLRSEPKRLPFDEVFVDVMEIVERKKTFKTLAKNKYFQASISKEPTVLSIQTGENKIQVSREELLNFWQQLRDFGLVYRSVAADRRSFSYLISVFAELPYVEPVKVSNEYYALNTNPATGLQVVPPYQVSRTPMPVRVAA